LHARRCLRRRAVWRQRTKLPVPSTRLQLCQRGRHSLGAQIGWVLLARAAALQWCCRPCPFQSLTNGSARQEGLRAQSTHILLTKRAWRTACHKEAWLQAYSRVRAGRRCQCRACRWNGSTTLEGQISLRLVGQISTPQARALVLAWSALRACHRRSSHHFDLLVRRRCRGQS